MSRIENSSSKICFISLDNINRIPYINIYKEVLKIDYDIIYWNRNNTVEDCGAKHYYGYYHKLGNNRCVVKINKLLGYIGFSRYVKKVLNSNKYSGVVAMPSNCCVLNYSILKKKFKGKYIIEIRDYWKEHIAYYYNLEKKAISDSYAAVISSPAYKKFLPEADFVQAHNIPSLSIEQRMSFRKCFEKKSPIVVACIGGSKNLEYDKKVLLRFMNDERFLIKYIGRGYEKLLPFCEENNIRNVYIEGMFPQEKTLSYYEDVDIILNLYGNNNPSFDYALSNKLYYAAQMGRPILVCPKTYMAETVELNGLGFVFDIYSNSALDNLYNYFVQLDREEFFNRCDSFLNKIEEDMNKYVEMIKSFEITCDKEK